MTPVYPPSVDPPPVDPSAPEAPPTELHLSEYWTVIKKRRRLVALCTFVALVFGVVTSVMTKPRY